MAQTFTHLLTHVIFSTKERRPLLKAEFRPRLFAYMGGIIRDLVLSCESSSTPNGNLRQPKLLIMRYFIRIRYDAYFCKQVLGGKALIINGTSDHMHVLVSMPATIPIAEMMRVVKSKSSRWVHEQFSSESGFTWQAGYGAFSVSHSNAEAVKHYIADQEAHHRKVSFQDELLSLLRKNGLEYDERYIWK